MSKTLHFHFYDCGAYRGETQRWIMCSYFSVINGRMHVGSSQMVKMEDWPAYRAIKEQHGWTERKPFYGVQS